MGVVMNFPRDLVRCESERDIDGEAGTRSEAIYWSRDLSFPSLLLSVPVLTAKLRLRGGFRVPFRIDVYAIVNRERDYKTVSRRWHNKLRRPQFLPIAGGGMATIKKYFRMVSTNFCANIGYTRQCILELA